MKLIFFLINMNLGGTEKSLQNLISILPQDYQIDILLLEKKGDLLNQLPKKFNVKEIENKNKINEFLKIGSRRFAVNELKRGNIFLFLKNIIVFSLYKIKILNHPFYGISNLITVQEEDYDIAVAYAGPHDFISYYTLNFIRSKKKFQWIHFDVEKVAFNQKFANKFYRSFDKIICVSKQVKRNLEIQLDNSLKPKILVYNNVLNYSEITEKSKEYKSDFAPGLINILTVGRLTKEKGHLEFLPVIEKLKSDDLKFIWTIIGDGKQRDKIESEIKNKKLENFVRILGTLKNPYPYFKDCDIYLQPSLYEGHSISIIEAKFFKRSILANNFAGIEDEIQNGIDGIICNIEPTEQYEQLKRLILFKDYRQKLIDGIQAKDRAKVDNPFVID